MLSRPFQVGNNNMGHIFKHLAFGGGCEEWAGSWALRSLYFVRHRTRVRVFWLSRGPELWGNVFMELQIQSRSSWNVVENPPRATILAADLRCMSSCDNVRDSCNQTSIIIPVGARFLHPVFPCCSPEESERVCPSMTFGYIPWPAPSLHVRMCFLATIFLVVRFDTTFLRPKIAEVRVRAVPFPQIRNRRGLNPSHSMLSTVFWAKRVPVPEVCVCPRQRSTCTRRNYTQIQKNLLTTTISFWWIWSRSCSAASHKLLDSPLSHIWNLGHGREFGFRSCCM